MTECSACTSTAARRVPSDQRRAVGAPWKAAGMALNDPFATHPPVPSFTVTSTTLNEGDTLGLDQMSGIFGVPGGKDVSPQLSWSGAPDETQGYAVTIYDPDA